MTQDEIIEMANEAELCQSIWIDSPDENLASVIRFAKLVAAKERELCITDIQWHIPRSGRNDPEYLRAKSMIERIRARGEA